MAENLRVKVCGMKFADNIQELVKLQPDYIGFILYAKSKRYIGNELNKKTVLQIPKNIQKVGVFVNSRILEIKEAVAQYQLDLVQLHGDENPAFCEQLKHEKIKIIKVFRIEETFQTAHVKEFESCCNYYLFDTQTPKFGGSGQKFDWSVLEDIPGNKPFFLSGGIGPEDADEILHLNLPNLFAVDVNSKFELEPGLKDIKQIKTFIETIK